MKWVRIKNGVVVEIIPNEATIPDIAHWYGEAFAIQCVEAPNEVEQHWIYNAETGTFSEPPEPEQPLDELTKLKLAVAELADKLAQDSIETKLAIAELAETLLGGGE